jgi:hypothetical protein
LRLQLPGAEHLRTPLADRLLHVHQLQVTETAIADRFDAADRHTASGEKARPYIPFDVPADTPRRARGW